MVVVRVVVVNNNGCEWMNESIYRWYRGIVLSIVSGVMVVLEWSMMLWNVHRRRAARRTTLNMQKSAIRRYSPITVSSVYICLLSTNGKVIHYFLRFQLIVFSVGIKIGIVVIIRTYEYCWRETPFCVEGQRREDRGLSPNHCASFCSQQIIQ